MRQGKGGCIKSKGTAEDTVDGKLVPPNKKLLALAASFAQKVSVEEFSPADLQDYLILHKKEPERPVDQFDEFETKTLETRALQAEG